MVMLYMGEVCLYDEVDRGRGDNVNGSRNKLCLVGGGMWRWRIASSVVAGANGIHGSYRRDHVLVVVLNFWVSRGV